VFYDLTEKAEVDCGRAEWQGVRAAAHRRYSDGGIKVTFRTQTGAMHKVCSLDVYQENSRRRPEEVG
jgi:hypothetical protein